MVSDGTVIPSWGVKPPVDPLADCGACRACNARYQARLTIERALGNGAGGEILGTFECERVRAYKRGQQDALDRAAFEAARERTA